MLKLRLLGLWILRVFIVSWSFLRVNLGNLLRRAGAAFQCRECIVIREWNEELKSENRYLKSLLLEPKEEKVVLSQEFKSIGRPTWKDTRHKLERTALKHKKEYEEHLPVETESVE